MLPALSGMLPDSFDQLNRSSSFALPEGSDTAFGESRWQHASGDGQNARAPRQSCPRAPHNLFLHSHSGTFSTKLATPMSCASGIFGFGLRIRAR